MIVDPGYETQYLRWEPFSSVPIADEAENSSSSLYFAQSSFQQALQEKRWLLENDQHLIVPKTHLDDYKGRIFSMGDFVQRADEARDLDVQRCSVDDQGQHRPLSQEQLERLKQTGELDVPSQLFENQHHTWKVTPWFYSGRQNVRHSLGEGVGRTLDHVVVFTGDSVTKRDSKFPTLNKALFGGLGKAAKLLRGALGQLFVGSLKHRTYSEEDINTLVDEAEKGYIQYCLREDGYDIRRLHDCTPSYRADFLDKLWEVLEDDASFGSEYRRTGEDLLAEQEADRRIASIRQSFKANMRTQRNARLKLDQKKALKSPKAARDEIEHATREWQYTKDKAWIDHLKNSTEEDMKDLGHIEVERLLALRIELQVKHEDEKQIHGKLKEYEETLKKRRPFMSLSSSWRKRKLDAMSLKMQASLEEDRLERVARRLKEDGLEVQCAARKHSAEFQRTILNDIVDRLRKKESPFPPAIFNVLQLNPNNWTFRANDSVSRRRTVEVDLSKPFWRARYTWMMVVSATKSLIGGAYHFLTAGPLSLRALFSPNSFYAVNRPIVVHDSLTQTLSSRLRSFFAALTAIRQRFESAPDTGLMGKSIQRPFIRIYLGIKGILGTLGIVSFMTIGTLVATLTSVSALILSPVLAVFATTVTSLFNLVVYDTAFAAGRRRFYQKRRRLSFVGGEPDTLSCASPILKIVFGVPYFLIFPGALQAIAAAFRLAVFHPTVAVATLSWTSLRFVVRSFRDSITWLFLQKHSRIPGSESVLAWRIHGPGVAAIQYYRLPLDAAKAAVLLCLDKYRMQAHSAVRRVELRSPYDRYRELFDKAVKPFGLGIVMKVQDPSLIGSTIASEIRVDRELTLRQGYHEPRPRLLTTPEHPLDIWDAVAQGIRCSHPDFKGMQTIQSMRHWRATAAHGECISVIDYMIRSDVDARYDQCKSKGGTQLDEMVNRAAKVLAEWILTVDIRERRLNRAMAIPPHAEGKFRMSELETSELWEFTLEAVEVYGRQLREELLEILETSEFSKELHGVVKRSTDSFYTRSGARPGQDVPVVASFLLRQLLGDEMLQTLEETDEELVLSPKISEEDEHLVFWRSFWTA